MSPLPNMAIITACLLGFVGAEPPFEPPKFDNYPVREVFKGPAKPIDLSSHPDAKRFRTRLREGAKEPADFAGHYKLVSWGCGTNCESMALVDLKTGRVYFGPGSAVGCEYRLESALLIVNPPEAIKDFLGDEPPDRRLFHTYYYAWDEKRKDFKLLYTDAPAHLRP